MPRVIKSRRHAVIVPPLDQLRGPLTTVKSGVSVRDATPFEIAVLGFLREWECFKNTDRNASTEEEIGDDVRDLDVWADRVEWEFRLQQINGPTVRVEMPPS